MCNNDDSLRKHSGGGTPQKENRHATRCDEPDEANATFPVLSEHSFSVYDFRMRNLKNSSGEDLFQIILRMDPAVVDNNVEWKERSQSEPDHAFILGRTIGNETPNLQGLLFNQKVKAGRQNVFLFSIEPRNGQMVIVIHRLDPHLRAIFSGPLAPLYETTPRERAAWNDPAKRQQLANRVLNLQAFPREEIRARVFEKAPLCRGNYALSCQTAELAYALMLQETLHKDVTGRMKTSHLWAVQNQPL